MSLPLLLANLAQLLEKEGILPYVRVHMVPTVPSMSYVRVRTYSIPTGITSTYVVGVVSNVL